MKSHTASQTAAAAAFLRALSQARPADARIIDDPLARRFVPRLLFRFLAGSRLLASRLARGVDYLATRDRVADDALRSELSAGPVQQVVLLGAGWDTAAFRLKSAFPQATCFEVDHPATQSAKERRVERLGLGRDAPIFVACDFEQDAFERKLVEAGFDPAEPAAVKWMGVTYYLTEGAIAATFGGLQRLLAPRSILAFDYWLPDPTARPRVSPGLLSRLGEPALYTPTPEQVYKLLAEHGFTVADELGMSQALERYPVRDLGWRDGSRFVVARRAAAPLREPLKPASAAAADGP